MANARQQPSTLLFTAFEPSGDAHAAPVIRELLRQRPELTIYAWGGPQMQQAGATIVEFTARDGAMGLGALKRAREVRRETRAIKRWAKQYRVVTHVAVDSPAANFPICRIMKKHGARVVHLVAPQLWAWGSWRKSKLRKLTDLVLCLLPFEEQWFRDRDIPAKFIGHPRVNRELDENDIRESITGFPQGSPRIVLLPGSRSQEVRANITMLVRIFAELQDRTHGLAGLIVAANPDIAKLVRRKVAVFPNGLHMITGSLDAAIAWCNMAVAVSGTVSLDIARQRKPMIGIYRTGIGAWLLAKVLLRTRYKLLPNIIAEREIVPEFIPHAGGVHGIVTEAMRILGDSRQAAIESEELARVLYRFANKKPDVEAARLILHICDHGVIDAATGEAKH